MSEVSALSKAQSFTWTFPGSPVTVILDLTAIDTLQRSLASGRHAGIRQGLLLGQIESGTTRITDFAPLADLEAGLAGTRAAGASGVGFYRFRPGDTMQLTGEEISAARRHFQRQGAVVLLIQPREEGRPEATFFFFERNMLCGGYLHFPLDAALLAEREHRAAPAEAIHPLPSPVPPPLAARLPAKNWIRRLGVGLAGLAAVAAGAALAYRLSSGAPPVATAPPAAGALTSEAGWDPLESTCRHASLSIL